MAGRLAALVAVAVLGGCGGASGGSETESSTGTQPAGTAAATAPEVLRFTTPIVGGGELDGSSLAGRPVAFWFWAPT
jgi:hypothetical protein